MKKMVALVMALLLCLSCVACGQSPSAGNSNETTKATEGSSTTATFPQKEITMICPFGAGGGTDALARKIASLAETDLGQTVLVTNLTGGAGAVGMMEGLVAKPDGYTVTMVTVECVLLPAAGLADFTPADFTPIIRINFDPTALIVPANSPYNTLEEFLAAAKAKPGDLSVMVGGYPANSWLAGALLQEEAGVELNIIPESAGAAEHITNLLGGHVDAAMITPAEAAAYIASGDLKMLAVAGAEREKNYAEIPTFKECGYNVEVGTWRGLTVPKGTPDDVVKVLNDAFTAAYNTQEMADFLESTGFGAGYMNSSDFAKLLDEQTAQYTPIVQKFAN